MRTPFWPPRHADTMRDIDYYLGPNHSASPEQRQALTQAFDQIERLCSNVELAAEAIYATYDAQAIILGKMALQQFIGT